MVSTLKTNWIIVFIFSLALILRLLFLSPFLEDWDSAQFALSLHHYSLIQELPHPPGYPLYILLGRLFLFFFKNENLSFTIISALLGALSVFPIYFLSKELFNKKVALIGTLFSILIPVQWTLSEVALTNIPGLTFELFIYWGLWHFRKNKKALLPLVSLAGLGLGLRFTEFTINTSLIGFIILQYKEIKFILKSAIFFVFGWALWLIPLILFTGLGDFIKAYTTNASYIFHHDSQLNQVLTFKALLHMRLIDLSFLLNISYTKYFLIICLISFVYIISRKIYFRKFELWFLYIWLVSYLVPLILFFNLQVPRYTLPLLPPLTILASLLMYNFTLKFKSGIIVILLLLALIGQQSLSQVKRFHEQIPPIIQGVNYIGLNFDPKKTIVISTYTKRQLEYYYPNFQQITPDQINQINTINPQVVITDTDTSKDKLIQTSNFRLINSKIYKGDIDIYTRTPEVTIYVLKD